MIKIALALAVVILIFGCAARRVNVDLDSCQERGKIDGTRIGQCEVSQSVK
jgi:hypothetical protein